MEGKYSKRKVKCSKCGKVRWIRGERKTSLCLKCCAKEKVKELARVNWKGGEYQDKRGYVYVTISGIKDKQIRKWAQESSKKKAITIPKHRLLIIEKLRRPLKENEVVHHLNGNKSDNRFINLLLEVYQDHRKNYFALLRERNMLLYQLRCKGC
jgi:Lhr-like helicase